MRVLVTGGAGFIGSHLCERLLSLGHEVVCLDDLSTGNVRNVAHLVKYTGFRLACFDVTDAMVVCSYNLGVPHVSSGLSHSPPSWLDLESVIDVQQIYNLACPASPVAYQRDPIGTIRTCVVGALNVLKLANRSINRPVRVLQASTSEVYGDATVSPQHERYWGNVNPVGPRSCYDEGKRCAESLFTSYRRHRGVDARIVRIFNTYGPRMAVDDGRVVSNFIVQKLRGQPLTVYGDGKQTRSLCYVDDMVSGLIAAMNSDAWADGGPMNLGNPSEVSMGELARYISPSGPLSYEPLPEDDPRHRRPDITYARRELGWEPVTPLSMGLAKTIAYFEHEQKEGRL